MKTERFILAAMRGAALAVALGLIACEKKETAEEDTPPPAKPVERPAATPLPATPAPKVADVPAATPAPEFAPPGVFFLTQAVSVTTDAGIFGLKPGDRVTLIRDGMYAAGDNQIALAPNQITNDLRLARQLAAAQRAQQAAIRQKLTPTAPKTPAGNASTAANPAPSALPPLVEARATPFVSTSSLNNGSTLSNGAYNNTKGTIYTDAAGQKYWKDTKGRHRYDF